jgi:hypothetical protein
MWSRGAAGTPKGNARITEKKKDDDHWGEERSERIDFLLFSEFQLVH